MVTNPNIPLSEDSWNDLRGRVLAERSISAWVRDVFSKSFEEIQRLPEHLDASQISRPRLKCIDRASYLRVARQITFHRSASEDLARHERKLTAIERITGERIVSLSTVKSDRSFHCYFTEGTLELIYFEEIEGQFLQLPRWREALLAWRGIAVVVGVLGLVSFLTSPTPWAAIVVFLAALAAYFLVIWTYGPRYSHVGIPTAIIIALLGGLLWGAWLRAEQRRQQLEQPQHERPTNLEQPK